MASLAERNGTYYIDIRDSERDPSRRRLSLRTKDKETARELVGTLSKAYRLGEWDPWTESVADFYDRPNSPLKLSDAISRFLEAKGKDVARLTLKSYRSVLGQFATEVGSRKTVPSLSRDEVERYTRDPAAASSTQRTRHSTVKTFFRWLRARGLTEATPMKGSSLPRSTGSLPAPCLPEDLRSIAHALVAEYIAQRESNAPPPEGGMVWHVDLWHFLLWTGLRIREAARLRWKDVKFSEGLILLHEQKSGEAGTSLLTDKARRVLKSYRCAREPVEHEEYVFSAPHTRAKDRNTDAWCIHRGQTFRRYRQRVMPEKDLSQHSLRHGFCTLLARRGCSAHTIKEAARHSDIQTSQRYVHLTRSDIRSEVDGVL
ncbi:site-specific recombinase XerD [Salinibacter ruber]|uniref:tyrosine-type recombinase/integrase n=1 Tax=Salinibacter ruber TaxID=146919 RepID=UPI0021692139|nr:site-specific integrase [Salinibacter ruber]MCS3853769.1 site-specific recombinase XerD [Salinibacter ruber]